MLEKEFKVQAKWSSNEEDGVASFLNSKTHKVYIKDKTSLVMSAAKVFKGDGTKHNPEDLMLSALASCHMMSYMYLCDKHQITLVKYSDETIGTLTVNPDGSGAFTKIEINPIVTILEKDKIDLALNLHKEANRLCFIANSCSATITHNPIINSSD